MLSNSTKGFLIGLSIASSLLLLFLLIPIVAIFALADFNVLSKALVRDRALAREAWSAFIVTLEASLISSLILLVFGIPLAYLLARKNFRGKYLVEGMIDVPLMLPHAVAGIMVLTAYSQGGLLGFLTRGIGLRISDSFWGIVTAMTFVSAPIFIDTVKVGIEAVDPMVELVARSLGATPRQVLTSITLPLTVRSIGAGFILSWARAVSEVGAILIVAYYPKSVNVLIIEWFNTYGLQYAIALSIPLVTISLGLFIIVKWVLRK